MLNAEVLILGFLTPDQQNVFKTDPLVGLRSPMKLFPILSVMVLLFHSQNTANCLIPTEKGAKACGLHRWNVSRVG